MFEKYCEIEPRGTVIVWTDQNVNWTALHTDRVIMKSERCDFSAQGYPSSMSSTNPENNQVEPKVR